jgi:hypothetical protein
MKAKRFDKKFDENKSDIVGDLDLSKIRRPNKKQELTKELSDRTTAAPRVPKN